MRSKLEGIERRVRVSGLIVLTGLLIELLVLRWSHPTAFLAFALIGMPLVGAGVLIFLYSLVSVRQ
jgi:hypothetical protein